MTNKKRIPPTPQKPAKRKNVASLPRPSRTDYELVDINKTQAQSTILATELAVSVATAAA